MVVRVRKFIIWLKLGKAENCIHRHFFQSQLPNRSKESEIKVV